MPAERLLHCMDALMDLGSAEDLERSGWTMTCVRLLTWLWLKLLDLLKTDVAGLEGIRIYDNSAARARGFRHRRRDIKGRFFHRKLISH